MSSGTLSSSLARGLYMIFDVALNSPIILGSSVRVGAGRNVYRADGRAWLGVVVCVRQAVAIQQQCATAAAVVAESRVWQPCLWSWIVTDKLVVGDVEEDRSAEEGH